MNDSQRKIAEPRPITVGANPEPWEGTEVEITVQNIPSKHIWTFTLEEALMVRDMLTGHLNETYGIAETRRKRAGQWVEDIAFAYVDAQPVEDAEEDEEQWRDYLSLGNAFGSPADMRDLIDLLKEVRDS